jgi:hypothetical protein
MLAISTTIAAAAYLLLGQPGHAGPPVIVPPLCQLTMNMNPAPPPPRGNHLSVRWVGGDHHRRHCHHRRCR